MTIERFGPPGAGAPPYSKAVRAGDFVFVSGQVPAGPDGVLVGGGIEAQTKQAIENVKTILTSLGLTLKDVVKATCWIDDARDFGAFNRVYMSYFPNGRPARSTTEARLMVDAKVEIDVVAYKPKP